ncbi:MAG: hypothetical protein JW881_05605 [Spirochaetales bacterium]|nr:hypothetical protein [Spirochaetales bacterium]
MNEDEIAFYDALSDNRSARYSSLPVDHYFSF